MAKRAEGVSVIPDQFRYDPFGVRTGKGRNLLARASNLPVVGGLARATLDTLYDTSPLKIYTDKIEMGQGHEFTDISFKDDNRTLAMTTALDSLFYLWGAKEWEPERAQMAAGLKKGLFNKHGDFSADTWLRARSSLGPFVLASLVQGALKDGKPVPHFTEVMTMFEHKEDTHKKRHDFMVDALITLSTMLGPGVIDYAYLKSLPTTTEIVANPAVAGAAIGGGAIGAAAGILLGLGYDALPGKDLNKLQKALIPIAVGALGMASSYLYVENVIVPGMDKAIQVVNIPLNDYGWTIPVAALGGGLIAGLPRMARHRKAHNTISHQIERLSDWRSMFAVMVNSLHYMRDVKTFMETGAPADVAKVTAVNRYIYTKDVPLSRVAEQFDHRDPSQVAGLQAVAGTTLLDLSRQVLLAEMMSFDRGYATHTATGGTNMITRGLIPRAADYFAKLDVNGLKIAEDTTNLVKTLGDKEDYVAALSVISPTLSPIMVTQAQMGKLGPSDDTQHFGEAGMNTGTRGYFLELTKATFNRLLTVPDSKRAVLTGRLADLGPRYEKSIPIGGLDSIYSTPAHMKLGALYGYAYLRAKGHTLNNPADDASRGEYGSKGLLSDVGKAALGAFKQNPLITYMFLADVTNAIEHADNLLVNTNHRTKREIKNALISLQREISTEIIRIAFPKDKESSVAFFTNGDYAFNAYLAMTMLTEVCGDDVVGPIIQRQAAVLSPIFGLDDAHLVPTDPTVIAERDFPSGVKFNGIIGDTPNLYTTQIIDFIHNAARHNTRTHRRLDEFLRRGMLPLLTREYLDRLEPGGRGEEFNQDQKENTISFAGYAFESAHAEDLPALVNTLINVLENTNRMVSGSLAPLGTVSSIPGDIQHQAGDAYRRSQALLQVAARTAHRRKAELQGVVPGSTITYAERINTLVEDISKKTGITVRVRVAAVK